MENYIENKKPLIILENHISPAAKSWLLENLTRLYEEDYKTFLLEMNHEITLENFELQLELAAKFMQDDFPEKIGIKLLIELVHKLKKLKFDIQFIDPETQEAAVSFDVAVKSKKYDEAQKKQIMALRELVTEKRDIIMADKIQEEANKLSNKVIFLGGYAHKNLVTLLKSKKYNFLLITDSIFNNRALRLFNENTLWATLHDENFIKKFYDGAEVKLIDTQKVKMSHNFRLFSCESTPEQLYQTGITKFRNKEYQAAIDILMACSSKFKKEPEKQAMCYSSSASCFRDWGSKEQKIIHLNMANEHIAIAEKILTDNSSNIANFKEKIVKINDKKLTIAKAILDLQNTDQPTLQPGK